VLALLLHVHTHQGPRQAATSVTSVHSVHTELQGCDGPGCRCAAGWARPRAWDALEHAGADRASPHNSLCLCKQPFKLPVSSGTMLASCCCCRCCLAALWDCLCGTSLQGALQRCGLRTGSCTGPLHGGCRQPTGKHGSCEKKRQGVRRKDGAAKCCSAHRHTSHTMIAGAAA
jgi:hypothetical protein